MTVESLMLEERHVEQQEPKKTNENRNILISSEAHLSHMVVKAKLKHRKLSKSVKLKR
jgi:hypothetical protein